MKQNNEMKLTNSESRISKNKPDR